MLQTKVSHSRTCNSHIFVGCDAFPPISVREDTKIFQSQHKHSNTPTDTSQIRPSIFICLSTHAVYRYIAYYFGFLNLENRETNNEILCNHDATYLSTLFHQLYSNHVYCNGDFLFLVLIRFCRCSCCLQLLVNVWHVSLFFSCVYQSAVVSKSHKELDRSRYKKRFIRRTGRQSVVDYCAHCPYHTYIGSATATTQYRQHST